MIHRVLRSLFIRTEKSPNPQFLKFHPGMVVLQQGSLDFPSIRQAANCDLAVQLFHISGVTRVFLAADYVGIGKSFESDWSILKPLIYEVIMEFFTAGLPVITEKQVQEDTQILETDSEELATIKEILQFRIKPFVRDDGGDIRFHEFNEETGVVLLEMRGSCAGCPSSSITLKNGIQNMLVHYVPAVKSVEAFDAA